MRPDRAGHERFLRMPLRADPGYRGRQHAARPRAASRCGRMRCVSAARVNRPRFGARQGNPGPTPVTGREPATNGCGHGPWHSTREVAWSQRRPFCRHSWHPSATGFHDIGVIAAPLLMFRSTLTPCDRLWLVGRGDMGQGREDICNYAICDK